FGVRADRKAEAERQERNRAEIAEGNARQNEAAALAAQDNLETALARSLNRPLQSSGGDILSEPEADVFWELAERPGERLWLRFIDEGSKTPLSARRFSARAEPALIAAAGLDPEKRQRVERLLAERLQEPGLTGRHRLDLAFTAGGLGYLHPINARRVAEVLLEQWPEWQAPPSGDLSILTE